MHGMYVKDKLYVYKCIKMHGIYVKGTLYIFINYQDARYKWEGNTIYIYKYIKMHVMYVKDNLYVYKCIRMHGIYVKGTLYIFINYQDAWYICEGNTIYIYKLSRCTV